LARLLAAGKQPAQALFDLPAGRPHENSRGKRGTGGEGVPLAQGDIVFGHGEESGVAKYVLDDGGGILSARSSSSLPSRLCGAIRVPGLRLRRQEQVEPFLEVGHFATSFPMGRIETP